MFTEKKLIRNIYNGHCLYRTITVTPTFDEVTINGLTWTSKNLALDDGEGGIYTHTHDYGQGSVTEYYYTWDAAVRLASKIDGWHLPSNEEWNAIAGPGTSTLETYGRDLKSTYGWKDYNTKEPNNGLDTYGFTVLPAGDRTPGESWEWIPYAAEFWTSYEQSTSTAKSRRFAGDMVTFTMGYKTYAYSVRLVKD